MRKVFFILCVLVLVWITISLYNSTPRAIISRLIKEDKLHSSKMRYRVYLFKILPIGEATLMDAVSQEYKGKKVYHLSAMAESLEVFSYFINAHAELDSYIETKSFNPLVFKQKLVVSGRRDTQKEVAYDQKSNIMFVEGSRRAILPDTQDPLSATFNIRRMDFTVAKDIEMNINTNQKNYLLKGTAHTDQIKIGSDTYGLVFLKANIYRRNKNPYHKTDMSIVLLKEGGNIPISIDVFNKGIFIHARLIDTE